MKMKEMKWVSIVAIRFGAERGEAEREINLKNKDRRAQLLHQETGEKYKHLFVIQPLVST